MSTTAIKYQKTDRRKKKKKDKRRPQVLAGYRECRGYKCIHSAQ